MADPTVPIPPPEKRTFGRFVIERELGRGGMGIVYKALDPRLKRAVALKVLIGEEALADTDRVKRFLREAHSVAKLRHPNVVQIYELGEIGKQHYFTMDFVEGGSLDSKIARALDGTKQPPRAQSITTASPRAMELSRTETAGPYNLYDTLTLVRDVSRGLGSAHAQGIVHRDVKPANILIDRKGVPFLTDFGLAKQVAGLVKSVLTLTGTVVGTPMYMSPEQAAGRVSDVGPPTDVWSLGVMLYEMLTGKCPFEGESLGDIFHQVAKKNPSPPSAVRGGIPAQVDGLVMKCLEKDPALRYADGNALADDLDRFLCGEQVSAQAPRALQQARITEQRLRTSAARRQVNRKRAVMATAIGVPVLALAIGIEVYAKRRSAAAEAHAEAITSATKLIDDKQWTKALSFIDDKLREYPADPALVDRRSQVQDRLAKVEVALSAADRAFERKDFVVARASYQDALVLDSLNERARLRFDQVEALLVKLEQSISKGDTLLADGDARGALSFYNEALATSPTDPRAIAGAEQAKERLAAAAAPREQTPPTAVPPTTPPSTPPPTPHSAPDAAAAELYQKALQRTEETKAAWEEALTDIDKALTIDPSFGAAWYQQGVLHAKLGRGADALVDFSRAIQSHSFVAESHYARGRILSDELDLRPEAHVEFEAAARESADQEHTLAAKARIALVDGDYVGAIDLGRQVLDRTQKIDDVYCVLGKAYGNLSTPDLDKSLDCFNHAIQLDPSVWTRYSFRAVVHYMRKEYDKGLSDADKAVEMSRGEPIALKNRACNLKGLGRFEDALAQFDALVKKSGGKVPSLLRERGEIRVEWATALFKSKDVRNAREQMQKVIADWEAYEKSLPPGAEHDQMETQVANARQVLASWR